MADQPPPPPPGFTIVDQSASGIPPPPPGFVMQDAGAEKGSWLDPLLAGASFNFSDEAAGFIGGLGNLIRGKSFGEGYDSWQTEARSRLKSQEEKHPVRSAALEIAGGLPSLLIPGGGEVLEGANIAKVLGTMAKTGAVYGGISGAGAGEGGIADRAISAGEGALGGAIAAPILGTALGAGGKLAGKVIDLARAARKPGDVAAEKVAERLSTKGGIDQAEKQIDKARGLGQNLSIADVGPKGVRSLGRTIANTPGAAGESIVTKTNVEAMQQGDRLKGMVGEALGAPEGDYRAAKEAIMNRRSSEAEPFYRIAYDTPVPFTHELEALLQTRSGKQALAAAKGNASDRREPWAQWFASVDDNGKIIDLKNVPDSRALDEVKRVLDGMVESAKAQPDGSPFAKARKTPASDAIQSVRDDLLKFMNEHNDAYKRARAVGMDNIEADEALEYGRAAVKGDARISASKMGTAGPGREKPFTDGQKELARAGAAEALYAKLNEAGFTHDGVRKIMGSLAMRERLRPFFKTDAEFNVFTEKLINEAKKSRKVAAVRGNSSTAAQLTDKVDADKFPDLARIAGHVAVGEHRSALQHLTTLLTRLGGLTDKVAENVSRMIMTAAPQHMQQIIEEIRAAEARAVTHAQKIARVREVISRFAGKEGGELTTDIADPMRQRLHVDIDQFERDSTGAPGNVSPGEQPPTPGATKAPDGLWYVPDPDRQGKWMRVEPDSLGATVH